MISYIRNLKSKSETKRKQFLLLAMIISMTMVSSVWLYNMNDRFTSTSQSVEVADSGKVVKDEGPFQLLVDGASSAYQNISASVGNIPFFKSDVAVKKDTTNDKQIDLIVVDKSKSNNN